MTYQVSFTSEHAHDFCKQGFAFVPQLARTDVAERIRQTTEQLLRNPEVRADHERFFADGPLVQIVNPQLLSPDLMALELREHAAAVARKILGADTQYIGEQAMIKPAGQTRVVWHQDEAYWDPAYTYQSVTVWVSLTDVTETDGYMCFVPGSRHGELLPHQPVPMSGRYPELELLVPPDTWRECPMHAGDASVHSSRTVHASAPNTSNCDRIAYALTFGKRPARKRGCTGCGRQCNRSARGKENAAGCAVATRFAAIEDATIPSRRPGN